jgi:hypothetical protein
MKRREFLKSVIVGAVGVSVPTVVIAGPDVSDSYQRKVDMLDRALMKAAAQLKKDMEMEILGRSFK